MRRRIEDTMLGAKVYVNDFPRLRFGKEEFQKLVLDAISSVRGLVFIPDAHFHYTSYARDGNNVRIIIVVELVPVVGRDNIENGFKEEAAKAIKSAVLQRFSCQGIEITVRTPDSAQDGYVCWGMPIK